MIRLVRIALGLFALLTFTASIWALAQSPFAAPYRERTEAELRVALERALKPELTPDRLGSRVAEALEAGETEEAAALARLAATRGVVLPSETRAALEKAEAASGGLTSCLACAWDPGNCEGFSQVATCNLPAELTPLGDLNAIRRGIQDWMNGDSIDRIDLSLGIVGLAATGAILVSWGTSASVKAGATGLRVARRAGALTPTMSDEVATLAARAIDWDAIGSVALRRSGAETLLTPAAARLADIAADVGRIGARTGASDTLALLRYADTPDELASVARVTETAGAETRGLFATLGKARVIRATKTLTELALLAIGLLSALTAQVLAIAVWLLRRWLRRVDRA
ncbi:hypothetical protein [Silicimonas sp. MF1-12-2]|uniref:hypothetical protein n=1 Tax=Silicimonas sp. MF1-12-2 TaxID=3384793 RepID=UPI0039B4383C